MAVEATGLKLAGKLAGKTVYKSILYIYKSTVSRGGIVVSRVYAKCSISTVDLQSALLLIYVGVRVVPVTFSCSNYLCISNPTYGNLILLEYCGGGDGGGEGGEAHLYHRARCCC